MLTSIRRDVMTAQCDLLIRKARICDPVLGIDERGDIAVSDGKIAAVGSLDRMRARKIVAADGATVLPGPVSYTHLRAHET